jgi:FdhD protein
MTNDMLKQFPVTRLYPEGQTKQWREEQANVAVEAPLTIDVEGANSYTTLCSPGDKRAMVVGFLFTEGIIRSMDDIACLAECVDDPEVVRVKLSDTSIKNATAPNRTTTIVSACGLCGSNDIQEKIESLPRVGDSLRIDAAGMQRSMDLLQSKQTVHKATGGTHAILLLDPQGEMLSFAEDIGRHNALDKAIGTCLLLGASLKGCGAVLSGRVSFEMVAKCSMAGIELILAVSAPTSLALTAAAQSNITVCAFVRNGGATLYTHPHRITWD